jgi:hypothetical protein
MAYSPIALVAPNYRDYTDYWLKAYAPGTTTPKIMALDSAASVTVAKVQLNADGFLKSAGGTLVIPYIDGSYDLWLFPTEAEADANDTINAEKLADNILPLNQTADINNLSLPYNVDSSSGLSVTTFPIKKVLNTRFFAIDGDGGGASYIVSASQDLLGIAIAGGLFANPQNITTPRQIGWNESGGEANYNLLDTYVKSGYFKNTYEKIYSMNYFYTQWQAGNSFPIAFTGDSTTDGATTTGHTSSTIAGGNANSFSSAVTINEDAIAYPAEIERQLKLLQTGSAVRCYNAGFDSFSLKEGGNFTNAQKAFHRMFFGFASGLCNVDFSDVKGVVLSWGVSDIIENTQQEVLDSYEYKMELLLIECFERGIQPFIADPVLCQQRDGDTVLGRDNDQLLTIIEAINIRLRQKHNLERFSLRVPLQTYAQNAFETTGDYAEVMTGLQVSDGVHPNNKGHRMIGSYYASLFCPLIKKLDGSDFKFPAASEYLVTPDNAISQDNWLKVDPINLITRSSYYFDFTAPTSLEFFYRIFVYCDKPMDLTYSKLSLGVNSRDTANYPRVTIVNQPDNLGRSKNLETDYYGVSPDSGSNFLIGRLDVGLNSIEVVAAATPIGDTNMGFLRAEPMYEANKLDYNRNESGNTLYQNNYPNIEWLQASIKKVWSAKKFMRENYAYASIGSDRRIKFDANTLHNRDILFNGGRSFNDFDRFDLIRCNGTSIQIFRVTSNSGGGETETLLASGTSSVDLSTLFNTTFLFNIQPKTTGTDVYLQYIEAASNQVVTLTGAMNMINARIENGGYSIGCQKNTADALPVIISNITDEFEY